MKSVNALELMPIVDEDMREVLFRIDQLEKHADRRFKELKDEIREAREESKTAREETNRRLAEEREETNRRFAEAREESKIAREETNRRFAASLAASDLRFKETQAANNRHFNQMMWTLGVVLTIMTASIVKLIFG